MAHDGGLTDADVVEAYRIFLEREPESAEAVAHHRAAHADRASLYRAMLASPEFLDRVSFPAVRAALHGLMSAPPPQVQHDAPPEVMARMVARIRDQWTRLGQTEPHWSVVTAERFRARNLAADPESLAFFRHTGAREAGLIDTFAARTGVAAPTGLCVELGCGVGRVTRHLADRFDRVLALDISPGNLALADAYMAEEGVTHVETRLVRGLEDFDALPPMDAFFSVITLQHNPPPVQKAMLRAVFDRLKPGGVALFQLLGEQAGYVFDAEDYLSGAAPEMEMHVLPRAVVLADMATHGVRPLDVVADARTGAIIGSTTFYGVKL